MMLKARILLTEEIGQTMAEYAFVISVIVISIVIAFGVLSGAIASSIDAAVAVVAAVAVARPGWRRPQEPGRRGKLHVVGLDG